MPGKTCKQWNPEWVARLYDELDGDERARLDAHLVECPNCRETMAGLERSRLQLRQAAPEVPDSPRVVVLAPASAGRRAWRPAWAFAAGVASATLVFSLGWFLGSAQPGVEPAAHEALTHEDLRGELERLRQQLSHQRAADMEYVMRSLTDTEVRTGTWMDQTQQALTYLALQQDPRFLER